MKTLSITLFFLGSIIGAGFATGAEIVTFFGNIPLPVWCIAIIVGLTMFAIITCEILLFSTHRKTIITPKETKSPKNSAIILDVVFVMIYLILFTAMTAGITQITNIQTCIISLIFSIYITLFGFHKLSRFNFFLVLVIIILIITTALPSTTSTLTLIPIQHWEALPKAFFQALLYAGLNCFVFPELIITFSKHHNRHTLFKASLITSITVTILLGLILSTVQHTGTLTAPMPLLTASPTPITFTVVLLAILTSQYTTLFAIIKRIQKIALKTNKKPLLTAALICFCAFVGSFCGFTHIIQFAYPLIGLFTCCFLLFSFLLRFWQFLQARRQSH